jgi:hypothetical protein
MVTEVEISRILPHPEHSNRMDVETLSKLRRHIEGAGRYEPLVVRPQPTEEHESQLIARKRAGVRRRCFVPHAATYPQMNPTRDLAFRRR